MSRTKDGIMSLPETPAILPAAEQAIALAQDAAFESESRSKALAEQIGYDGSLTVGALEDGIRFYQRRSVEALLEVGKRLLLLKEKTPHGEFADRVEMLGIAERTARRFMQAASKVSKSANLAVLAGQVKSQQAFLELVTHDDDADIDRVATMDDIDRMSASQVRAALREKCREHEAVEAVSAKKSERIEKLEREKVIIERKTPDEKLAQVKKEAASIAADAEGAILGNLRLALQELSAFSGADQSVYMAGLVGQVQAQLNALRTEFNLPDVSNAATQALAGEVAQWAN